MRLAAYLKQEKLSPAAFGRLREPAVPRITVYQWARGTRFPSAPADLQWIEQVSAGAVTSADFVAHAMEIRATKKVAA